MSGSSRGLSDVRRFVIPAEIVKPTLQILEDAGSQGQEAFVLWGGQQVGDLLRFSTAIRPRQMARATKDGLLVTVDGQALFEVNKTLYERGEVLAAQVHSHPSRAFHSSTDDHYPLVTLVGALSLVIPDFARFGRGDNARWAWYRLEDLGRWTKVEPDGLIELEP